MAKHKYLTNVDGGYFYRFYPKFPNLHFPPTAEKDIQSELFPRNPTADIEKSNISYSFHGMFSKKYNDKSGLVVELISEAEYTIEDKHTGEVQQRNLRSIVALNVPPHIYSHPFKDDKIYFITTTQVKEIIL